MAALPGSSVEADLHARRPDPAAPLAIITGASSGIGEAMARLLAESGFRVGLVARRRDRLEHLAGRIERAGAQAALHLTLLFLPGMLARRRGHIINVGSVAGGIPSQGVAVYSATKSFLDSFSTALHRELRGTGVHVGVVRPGYVETELSAKAAVRPQGKPLPGRRFGVRPEQVARAIGRMIRRPRRVAYVSAILRLVPWLELSFDWAMDRIGPALLGRRTARPHDSF